MDKKSNIYIPEIKGCVAMNIIPSKELKEYHENSYIQINTNNEVILKKNEELS